MLTVMKCLLWQEEGQGMVEYGLIIGLIAVALIAALTAMSGGLSGVFNKISNTLNAS